MLCALVIPINRRKSGSRRPLHGFISVGAVCQRFFQDCIGMVVSSVLALSCLVKRKWALRGRNLPRDSRAEGASGLWRKRARGRFFTFLRTPEPCLRKSHGEAVQRVRVNVSIYICSSPAVVGLCSSVCWRNRVCRPAS